MDHSSSNAEEDECRVYKVQGRVTEQLREIKLLTKLYFFRVLNLSGFSEREKKDSVKPIKDCIHLHEGAELRFHYQC